MLRDDALPNTIAVASTAASAATVDGGVALDAGGAATAAAVVVVVVAAVTVVGAICGCCGAIDVTPAAAAAAAAAGRRGCKGSAGLAARSEESGLEAALPSRCSAFISAARAACTWRMRFTACRSWRSRSAWFLGGATTGAPGSPKPPVDVVQVAIAVTVAR